jgi:UDP-3-O-[3-hydroxymyristoyl] glucosamine N-acyltransferase
MLSAQTVLDDHADQFTYLHGDLTGSAEVCRSPEDACGLSLVYVSDAPQLTAALRAKAAIVILDRRLSEEAAAFGDTHGACFAVASIPTAMGTLLSYFDRKRDRFTQWGDHHPTAVVHPTALIGTGVVLGPYCVIGAGASIGDGCCIGAHVVIENGAFVGAGTMLHPQVFVGADCRIGERCEIHPHTSIGSDGFGYVPGRPGHHPLKIPHLGNVVIGDEVEIGSSCAIDRAKLTSTFIRSGAKLDNLCHIAHNCDLGEDGMYTAGFMMAGSTTIGKRFVTGGNSVVSAHLRLADDVALAGRSTVTNDVLSPGPYGGYPLQPLREALKTLVSLGQLNEIRRNLGRVMKHLGIRPE